MKEIILSSRGFTMVDDDDFERFGHLSWNPSPRLYTTYVMKSAWDRITSRAYTLLLHREIMEAPDDVLVDHIDGNGLNNQRSNLRLCDKTLNCANSRFRRDGRSQFKGVSWCHTTARWRATIRVRNCQIHIGRYDDDRVAAKAYDKAASSYFGEFARLNFPEDT